MRNDQIAVLLRDFANRCMQWALVLEKEDADKIPLVPVPLPGDPTTQGTPSPSGATTPDSSNVGNAGVSLLRQQVELLKHDNDALRRVQRSDARRDAEALPLTFTCPSCKQVRRWQTTTGLLPWPGAVCSTCYAERLARADGDV